MRSILFAVLLLTGCATAPVPDNRPPATVDVPVAVSCLPVDRPVRPTTFTDLELKGLDDYKFVLALRRDAVALFHYARALEAVLKACE